MEATSEKTIWLIGEVTSSFPDGIVTVRDALRVYFYYRIVLLKQRKPSVTSLANDMIAHWNKLGIATMEDQDIARKINKILDKHDLYKKSMHRNTSTQRLNEQKFIDLLHERFDIFSKVNYHPNKKNKLEPEKTEKLEQDKPLPEPVSVEQTLQSDENLDTDIDMSDVNEIDFNDSGDLDFEMSVSKYHRSQLSSATSSEQSGVIQKIIDSPDVSSVLDRTGISTPKFTLLCAAIAGAIGENVNECTLSTSTCYRRRKVHRDRIVTTIKDEYISSSKANLVLHWDGKKLQDKTNEDIALRKKKVERLAVVVSGIDGQKIITIAKTEDGTGLVIADTVYEHVIEWSLSDVIIGVCTDTTAANTGTSNGSVVLYQNRVKRNLLYFACRHHVDELVIGGVFVGLFGDTTGPSPELFEHFKGDWHLVNRAAFKVSAEPCTIFSFVILKVVD